MRINSRAWMMIALVAALLIRPAPAPAQLSPVTLKVDVIGDTERDYQKTKKSRKKATSPKLEKVVRERQLDITVANRSNKKYEGLLVKYYFFGIDVNTDEPTLIRVGKLNAALAPLGKVQLQSDKVTIIENAETTKMRDGKQYDVPASGYDFGGYGVQVLDGQTVITEFFDPKELKGKISDAWATSAESQQQGDKNKKSDQ